MIFFHNNVLIYLNTTLMPQSTSLDNRKAYFDDMKRVIQVLKQLAFCSSIMSANQGVGWRVKACADNTDAGVQNQGKPADVTLEHSLIIQLEA